MVHYAALAVAIGAATVAAQTSTVIDLMLPAVDPHSLVGSIVSASPSITTYAVQCAEDVEDSSECGLLHATTIAQGPSTWSMHYSHSDEEYGSFEQDMACDIDRKKDRIHCSVKMIEWSDDGITRTTSTVAATSGLSNIFIPVTITAGFENLDAAPGSTGGVSAAIETETTATFTTKVARPNPTVTDSESESSAIETSETSPAETSESIDEETSSFPAPTSTPSSSDVEEEEADATSTNSDNAAFPRATQNAFLAGVAVVVGGALMM